MFAYKAKLEAMESDEFAKLKSSLCSKLMERLFSEKKLWRCYWGEITDGTFCFDWKKETAQKVEAYYDGVYDVSKVDEKDVGGDMAHWEVGGV